MSVVRPVVVIVARAAGDAEKLVVAVVAGIQAVAPVLVGIVFGPHTAAAAPVLVADAEVLQPPRLLTPVSCPQRPTSGSLPARVMYSTHCDISCTVPLPTLPQT